MTDEEVMERYTLVTDVWKFLKYRYKQLGGADDAFWNEAINAANTVIHKNGDTKLAKGFVMAMLEDMEIYDKEHGKEGK